MSCQPENNTCGSLRKCCKGLVCEKRNGLYRCYPESTSVLQPLINTTTTIPTLTTSPTTYTTSGTGSGTGSTSIHDLPNFRFHDQMYGGVNNKLYKTYNDINKTNFQDCASACKSDCEGFYFDLQNRCYQMNQWSNILGPHPNSVGAWEKINKESSPVSPINDIGTTEENDIYNGTGVGATTSGTYPITADNASSTGIEQSWMSKNMIFIIAGFGVFMCCSIMLIIMMLMMKS
jgi:hypothetical protein